MVLTQKRIFIGIGIFSVLIAHFFISLGRDELFIELIFEQWYFIDLFFVSVICGMVLGLIIWLNYRLGIRFPLKESYNIRILSQIVLGIGLPSLLCVALTISYFSFVLNQQLSDTLFIVYEFPVAIIVIAFINIILLLADSLRNEKNGNAILKEPVIENSVMVQSADQVIPLPVSQIKMIVKRGNYCFILTNNGNEYLKTEPLSKLFQQLKDNDKFFHANRQYILSKQICKSYATDRSGKLRLTLNIPNHNEITISQRKGLQFKKWLSSKNTPVLQD